MKDEQIIDLLNDVSSDYKVTNIIISEKGLRVETKKEFIEKNIVKKTKLCKTLANKTVKTFQEMLHSQICKSDKDIEDLKAFERILNRYNKAGELLEAAIEEGD